MIDFQYPHFEVHTLGGGGVLSGGGDDVDKPIGSATLGHIIRAVCPDDIAHHAVPVVMIGAVKFPQRIGG